MALLEVTNVTKHFGGLAAVNSVSLEADTQSVTALIGPNGAGKTTLFNILTGFDALDSGTVALQGKPIHRLRPWQIARLGMVRTFQTAVGFRMLTVWENVIVGAAPPPTLSMFAAVRSSRAWHAHLDKVCHRAENVLKGLSLWDRCDTLLEDLTVGDTKLVEFARQLVAEPRMVLLDEPASGVNPAYLSPMTDLLRRLSRNLGVVVIDHNLSFIMDVADYVYVLAGGAIIASGRPDEVSRDPRVMETYLGTSS